jgi:hypothetical protein
LYKTVFVCLIKDKDRLVNGVSVAVVYFEKPNETKNKLCGAKMLDLT